MADPSVRREVERAITRALSRKGIAGTVVVQDSLAELHGVCETPIAIDLGDWIDQWALLPAEMSERRAEAAATRFVNALGTARGERRARRPLPVGRLLTGATFLALGASVMWWLHGAGFFGRNDLPAVPQARSAPPPISADLRARRACEAARERLYAGADMSLDTAGWLVELWLAGRDAGLADHPAVVGAPAAARTAMAIDGTVEVKRGPATELTTIAVTFGGDIVRAFFETAGRERLVTFAARTASEAAVEHAALYARCAHLDVHDVGAWYFGRDETGVIATLWLTAGAHAEDRPVDVARFDGALSEAAKRAAPSLEEAIRAVGARREEHAGGIAYRFPLGGPTRAAQLSRTLASEAQR